MTDGVFKNGHVLLADYDILYEETRQYSHGPCRHHVHKYGPREVDDVAHYGCQYDL